MNSNSFWSDPKVYISLLAILISIAAFLFTLANQTEQNRRWDKINLGDVKIKQVEFIRFNTLPREVAKKTNWGYNVLLLESGEEPDKVFTINCLQIFDIKTNQIVPYSKFCRTIQDVNEELQDLKIPAANVIVKQVSKVTITIENIGKTEVKNLATTVLVQRPNGNWEPAFVSAEKLNLGAAQILYVPLTINFSLGRNIPEEMNFNIKMEYQDVNDHNHIKSQNMKWTRREDKWSFLEAEETISN